MNFACLFLLGNNHSWPDGGRLRPSVLPQKHGGAREGRGTSPSRDGRVARVTGVIRELDSFGLLKGFLCSRRLYYQSHSYEDMNL